MRQSRYKRVCAGWAWTLAIVFLLQPILAISADARSRHPKVPRYEFQPHNQQLNPHGLPTIEGVLIIDVATGKEIVSVNPTALFNPASNIKTITSLAVLRKFGPNHRFTTQIHTTGITDSHGALQGDLYISGNYLLFGEREAAELVKQLNKRGIRSITGHMYVSSDFTWDAEDTGIDAGKKLKSFLGPARKRAAKLRITGDVKIGTAPTPAALVATHYSPPLRLLLKRMMLPSDNEMAHRFGEMIGGAAGLTQFVVNDLGVPAAEASFASTSGLYVNRLSPPAMMKVLQALRTELAQHKMTFADIMPVAGVDTGTMARRLNASGQAGSVIAKTGTLPETDNGVSALSGEMHTRNGTYLFVLFTMRGAVSTFKAKENQRITEFQRTHGGAKPIAYKPILPGFQADSYWQ